jgi:hypothetical protein
MQPEQGQIALLQSNLSLWWVFRHLMDLGKAACLIQRIAKWWQETGLADAEI